LVQCVVCKDVFCLYGSGLPELPAPKQLWYCEQPCKPN
jgi:hypothetical protein